MGRYGDRRGDKTIVYYFVAFDTIFVGFRQTSRHMHKPLMPVDECRMSFFSGTVSVSFSLKKLGHFIYM